MSELEASEDRLIPALLYYSKQRKLMLNCEAAAARFQAGEKNWKQRVRDLKWQTERGPEPHKSLKSS